MTTEELLLETAKSLNKCVDRVIALEAEVKELKKGDYFKHMEELRELEN